MFIQIGPVDLVRRGAFAALAWLCLTAATGRAQTLTAAVSESGFNQRVYGGNAAYPTAEQGLLTSANNPETTTTEAAAPWNFSTQNYVSLTSLTSFTITLTLTNGSTAPPDGFDVGNLTLGLNGTDTGLLLNGFGGDNTITTLTFTNAPLSATAGNAILASLKSSGGLVNGTIIDAAGSAVDYTQIIMGNGTGTQPTTTLVLSGTVPEPGTAGWLAAGLSVLVAWGWTRRAPTLLSQ